MQIKRIAIVGGGTSGWLAANHLGKKFLNDSDVSVTLIESPDIPNIGVGEGTVPSMVATLKSFGISETEFIRECDVTFKQSIKFVNWLDKASHGEDNYYHHLFEQPYPLGEDVTPYWLAAGAKGRFSDVVSPQGVVCDLGKGPKRIITPEYERDLHYAYHLDAAKFSKLLSEHAKNKFFVNYVSANVDDVSFDSEGNIATLKTDRQGELEFDFYVDCSGFSAFLIGKKLGVAFIDKKDQLFIDRAIVAQVPTAFDAPIPPYTIATAHQAGWIWDIALTQRRGTGFVYSSAHMDKNEAEKKFDIYLGGALADVNYREIPMNVGYREKFWHKNCVAVGLAQGFVEPLEATAMLVADLSAKALAADFPNTKNEMAGLSIRFNDRLKCTWDGVVDFIQLHYYLSDRNDSEFWVETKNEAILSKPLRESLIAWGSKSPVEEEFFSGSGVFNVENFLYVLYGMNFKSDVLRISSEYVKSSERSIAVMHKNAEKIISSLPSHRDLLDKIKKYGLQKV